MIGIRVLLPVASMTLIVGNALVGITVRSHNQGRSEDSGVALPTFSPTLRPSGNQTPTLVPAVSSAQQVHASDAIWRQAGFGSTGAFITLHCNSV